MAHQPILLAHNLSKNYLNNHQHEQYHRGQMSSVFSSPQVLYLVLSSRFLLQFLSFSQFNLWNKRASNIQTGGFERANIGTMKLHQINHFNNIGLHYIICISNPLANKIINLLPPHCKRVGRTTFVITIKIMDFFHKIYICKIRRLTSPKL